MPARRPTRQELQAASDKLVDDVIAPGLKVLFCGINPGLYTAAVGFHFGRPGNRFWPALHLAGITPRLLDPSEQAQLLALGYGITNIVPRASAAAEELSRAELVAGGQALVEKVLRFSPRILAVLGVGAYRAAFDRSKATTGPQAETIGKTHLWVLPNPSGLNAHYSLEELAAVFRKLKQAAE